MLCSGKLKRKKTQEESDPDPDEAASSFDEEERGEEEGELQTQLYVGLSQNRLLQPPTNVGKRGKRQWSASCVTNNLQRSKKLGTKLYERLNLDLFCEVNIFVLAVVCGFISVLVDQQTPSATRPCHCARCSIVFYD